MFITGPGLVRIGGREVSSPATGRGGEGEARHIESFFAENGIFF